MSRSKKTAVDVEHKLLRKVLFRAGHDLNMRPGKVLIMPRLRSASVVIDLVG